MRGQDGEIGEDVRNGRLAVREAHDDRRIVGVVHERHVGEIAQPRVAGGGIAGGGECPGNVARRGGHSIVPPHARLQAEHQRLPIVGPRPRAREIRLHDERRVVAHERGEQDVSFDLLGERVNGEERVEALELRARRIHDRAGAAGRCSSPRACRDQRRGPHHQAQCP